MIPFLLLAVLALAVGSPAFAQGEADDVVLDATFVHCNDTTESLLVLRDGRAVYAFGNRGAAFALAEVLVTDLLTMLDSTQSVTDTTNMDSCATLGLILEGPRYLLINTAHPAKSQRAICGRIDRLRTMGQRKMEGTIERFAGKLIEEPDSNMLTPATAMPGEIRRRIRMSPVAREWRCTGSVFVAAWISNKGKVTQAFVQRVRSRGKCGSLLSTSALRAVLLATYEPATHRNGRPMACWTEIEVPFSRSRTGN